LKTTQLHFETNHGRDGFCIHPPLLHLIDLLRYHGYQVI